MSSSSFNGQEAEGDALVAATMENKENVNLDDSDEVVFLGSRPGNPCQTNFSRRTRPPKGNMVPRASVSKKCPWNDTKSTRSKPPATKQHEESETETPVSSSRELPVVQAPKTSTTTTSTKMQGITPRARYEEMMETFRSKVEQSLEEVHRLHLHKTGLLEERFQATAKERLGICKTEQPEAQQMAEAEAKGSALVSGIAASFDDLRESLAVFLKEEQQSFDTNHAATSKEGIAKKFEQIVAEEEEWIHLERGMGLVKAECQEQERKFTRLRDEARDRAKVAEQEEEDLKKLLEAKQQEVASLRAKAAGYDEFIHKRSQDLRDLEKIREGWQTELAASKQQKEAHDLLVEREPLVAVSHRQVKMAETFHAIVAKEINFDVLGTQEEDGSSPDNGKLVGCEAAVIEAKEDVQATESSLQDLEREQVQLQDKLQRYRELADMFHEKDVAMKAAAAEEDHEKAAELDEAMQGLFQEIQSLGLTRGQMPTDLFFRSCYIMGDKLLDIYSNASQ